MENKPLILMKDSWKRWASISLLLLLTGRLQEQGNLRKLITRPSVVVILLIGPYDFWGLAKSNQLVVTHYLPGCKLSEVINITSCIYHVGKC